MMAYLSISLLGPFSAELDGENLRAFHSDKVRALLAYLSVEAHRPWARSTLAALLWPDFLEESALGNLRNALSNLREVIGDHRADPPFLHISRTTLQFNAVADYRLDLQRFLALAPRSAMVQRMPSDPIDVDRLQAARDLYRGDFLEGFSIDSAPFEEWMLATRQQVQQKLLQTIQLLTLAYEQRGDLAAALGSTLLWLELEPWNEAAHRSRMDLLARAGQRSAAIAQYEACCLRLQEELGIEPEPETTQLYKEIRGGKQRYRRSDEMVAAENKTKRCPLPPFLTPEKIDLERDVHNFVARQKELRQLEASVEQAVSGKGGAYFLSGEPGSGKTHLMLEVARRAMVKHADLLVLWGECNAYTGQGDPYLPFMNMTRMLVGAADSLVAGNAIFLESARRMWQHLPVIASCLVDSGPQIVSHFIADRGASATISCHPSITLALEQRFKALIGPTTWQPAQRPSRTPLSLQFIRVVVTLAHHHPLLLVVDDLQWIDRCSVDLLFQLARSLPMSRILLLGAYRPGELCPARKGTGRFLSGIIEELQAEHGEIVIDLAQSDGRAFVEAFVDSEPNELGPDFRQMLYRHTNGNPLFTIELLRAMQLRKELKLNRDGKWVEGSSLKWDALPSRVAAVISHRIGQLSRTCRALLDAACVQGDQFSALICARVLRMDEREVQRLLSRELCKEQRLVIEQGTQQVATQKLFYYRFRHTLFRQHLYGQLDEAERRCLHEDVGLTLEALYGKETAVISSTLAYHFQKAEMTAKAIAYTLQAGDAARALYAHEEAIDYYHQAMSLQKQDKLYGDAGRTLMKLGLTHHQAFQYRRAQLAFDEGFHLWQQAGAHLPAAQLLPAGTLRVCARPPLTLDPALDMDFDSWIVIQHLFAGLVQERETMEVVPDIAARWEIVDEGHTYIFHLRPDVRWSDGTLLTAHDFEFSWKRVLAPETHSPLAPFLYDIRGAQAYRMDQGGPDQVGIIAQNAQTLIVRLEQPAPFFLHCAAGSGIPAVPRHAVEALGARWNEAGRLVSSGPFCLRSWREDGMELVRNESYYRPCRGNVERLLLEFWDAAGDWERLARLYETGSLDVLPGPLYMAGPLQRFAERHLDELLVCAGYGLLAIAFNLYRPPFSDARVRRAFALAIDRESFVREAAGLTVTPALGGIVPVGSPGHAPGIGLPFDPASARALLAQAGFPAGEGFPTVSLAFTYEPGKEIWCRWLARQWQTVLGVPVEGQILDLSTLLQLKCENMPPLVGWNSTSEDALGWHTAFHDSWLQRDSSRPAARYRELIAGARQITNQEDRMRHFREADRLLVENAYVVPVCYHPVTHTLLRPRVKHYPLSVLGTPFWEDAIVEPVQIAE